MTTEMWRDLGRALDEVAYDPGILVMIVTGAGADFCAGADVTGTPGNDPRVHPLSRMQLVNRSVLALHHLPVPTIARVDGVAVGAGCNLALGCDLVIASDRARFSEIFMRRAMSVDGGGSWLLPRLIGLQRAKELCFLADIISAQDAARIGLVSRVVPVADLERTVDELAGRLAAAPPVAVQQTKRLLNEGAAASFEQALQSEARAQSVNLQGAGTAEAFQAFLDKREATFTGRAYRDA
jgi:enoyl-CoA hydratase/carnithine racemase